MLYYFVTLFVDLFCGAIVPLVVVFIIFGIVRRSGVRKIILIALLTLYLAEMLDMVGIPYIQTMAWNPKLNPIPFHDLLKDGFAFSTVFQFAANMVLFIPFGVLLPMIWQSFRRLRPTLLAGATLSLGIELAQLFSARVTATDDLLLNVLGTALGYFIIAGASRKRRAAETGTTWKSDRAELLIVVGSVFVAAVFIKYSLGSLVYSLPMFS